jgi:uncharacterized alkaline shock family protein YloU
MFMANIKYNFSSGNNGTVHYNADILNNIVKIAVKEVEGVYGLTPGKGIRLSFDKDGVYVTVSVIAEYGHSVPELAYRIQGSIKQAVESMTRYKVTKVDVHVQEVIFPEEEEALAATAKAENKEQS